MQLAATHLTPTVQTLFFIYLSHCTWVGCTLPHAVNFKLCIIIWVTVVVVVVMILRVSPSEVWENL